MIQPLRLVVALLSAFLAVAASEIQVPRIGIIDFYGLGKLSEERVRRELGFKEGDPLPPSKGAVEDRLEQTDGVALARLEAVCCEGGKAILYVGIEEVGAPHFTFRNPPEEDVALPEDLRAVYGRLAEALEAAARRGETGESLISGHPRSADSAAREIQDSLPSLADKNFARLRQVLRNGADPAQRAEAAALIVYSSKKAAAADDLQYALQDPEDAVRTTAANSLAAIAVLAAKDPSQDIRISPTWFIEMLHSIIWGDRVKACQVLVTLTESREARVLDQIREGALPALAEMARWRSLAHALPAFILIGRLAGLAETDIQDAWTKGDREPVIAKAMAKPRAR